MTIAHDQAPAPPAGLGRDDVFRTLGALGGLLTLAGAFMFYFGWRRSEAQSRAMGIDLSFFGFTSQDYVLRSISSLYLPLLVISGLGLAWVAMHVRITRAVRATADPDRARRRARRIARSAGSVGVACVAFTVAAGFQHPWPPVNWLASQLADRRWIVPLVLVVATLVTAYAAWAQRVLSRPDAAARANPWASALAATLTGAIVVLSLFWMLEEYAAAVGRGYAQQLVENVESLPQATVISQTPLGIGATGVQEEVLAGQGEGGEHYRTTGLRLLARTQTKILLVPDGWTPATSSVVVVPDNDTLVWEFSR